MNRRLKAAWLAAGVFGVGTAQGQDAPAAIESEPAADASAPADVRPDSAPGSEALPVEDQGTIPVADATATPEGAPVPAPAEKRGALGIEEIVVTAQRRQENINDVPIAISAFTGDALQELGITDTRDLGNIIPGLSVSNSGFNKPVYTLRGVGFNETSQTASSTVGVYTDEINFPFDVMTKGANLDLERVEVLKGPQGTLYGRNTTGGAVNYVSKKPTDSFESGLTAGYGRYRTADVEGFVSGPLTDSLKARLAVREIDAGKGWQHSNTRPDDHLGKVDKQSGRLLIDWQAAEHVPVRFTFAGWRDHSEPQAPQAIGIRPQNQIVGDPSLAQEVRSYPLVPVDTDSNSVADWTPDLDFQLRDSFWMGGARTDWGIGEDLTLTLQGAYEDYRSKNSTIPISGLNVINTENRINARTRAGNLEARLAGNFAEDAKWQLGAFVSRDKVHEDLLYYVDTNSAVFPVPGSFLALRQRLLDLGFGDLDLPVPLPGDPALGNRLGLKADQTADTQALFAHLEFPLLETVKGTAGLRYTNEVRDYAGCTTDSKENTKGLGFATVFNGLSIAKGGSGGIQPGGCFTLDENTNDPVLYEDKLKEDNVSGRLALDWKPIEDALLYLSYSRGFKSGSFPAISASSTAQLHPVKQEQLDAIETGGKITPFAGLHVDYALFHYRYKDKQLLSRVKDPIFGPLPVLKNAPKSRVNGAELSIEAQPLSGLYLTGAVTYLDTKVLKFVGVDEAGETRDFAGNPFNFAPKWSYTLLANYVVPLTDRYDLTLGTDYGYKGRTNSVLGGDPLYEHESYGVLNARVGVGSTVDGWTVTAWCRNLTDEFYTVSVFASGDSVSRFAGPARTYGLTLAYTWD